MTHNAQGAVLALAAFSIYSTHDVVVKTLGGIDSPLQIVFFANLFGFPVVTVMLMRDRSEGNLRPRHPLLGPSSGSSRPPLPPRSPSTPSRSFPWPRPTR